MQPQAQPQHQQGQGPPVLTTEQIQQLLDENYVLVKAILEQQNLGRLQDMAQYQHKLQQNLMLLANVADHQPQPAKPDASTSHHHQQPSASSAPNPNYMKAGQAPMGAHPSSSHQPYPQSMHPQMAAQQQQHQPPSHSQYMVGGQAPISHGQMPQSIAGMQHQGGQHLMPGGMHGGREQQPGTYR